MSLQEGLTNHHIFAVIFNRSLEGPLLESAVRKREKDNPVAYFLDILKRSDSAICEARGFIPSTCRWLEDAEIEHDSEEIRTPQEIHPTFSRYTEGHR
jgi:hypothetical protein